MLKTFERIRVVEIFSKRKWAKLSHFSRNSDEPRVIRLTCTPVLYYHYNVYLSLQCIASKSSKDFIVQYP
uniref:Uncharacterized protein n=1 Tax=Megaselia scalaris TaxID=36166 RepID=T1GUF3_MEGSC